MTYRSAGLAAGFLSLLASASPALAAPAAVTVRVEGAASTVVAETPVATTATPVVKQGNPCSGTSAGGALELATAGDWGGSYFAGLGQTVDRVRSESYAVSSSSSRYWALWVNNAPATTGICTTELQTGDEVLLFVDCFGAGCVNPKPLILTAPRNGRRGQPLVVKVEEVTIDANFTANRGPSAGVSITGAGPAVLTGSDGTATLTPDRPGALTLTAGKPDSVRDSAALCVADGDDGSCGTSAAAGTGPAVPVTPGGGSAPSRARDTLAPAARVSGIREQQRFSRASAPRELRGVVAADPSGLATVKLRLTRRDRGRCAYFSGRKERFVKTRCGRSFFFGIGDRAAFSYLLPERLDRGRYVLDVIAVDRAGNRDRLARGRNRVVFTVR